jgi:hypothetical protein
VSVKDTLTSNAAIFANAGGLVGDNEGVIEQSYATGAVSGGSGLRHSDNHVWVGGLAGHSRGQVFWSYATGSVSVGDQGYAGGLVGDSDCLSLIQSYSIGQISAAGGGSESGGFVGSASGPTSPNTHNYWDTETSGKDEGTGNESNVPGITGLTTAQLQSGLPAGFDPTIWGLSPSINNGLPYLLALPPQ